MLHFDEQVSLALGQATVIGPDGATVSTGHALTDNGTTVKLPLHPGVGAGTYVVSYRVISPDNHPVAGGYFFQVGHGRATTPGGAPAAPTAPGAASESAPEDPSVRALYAACRYAGFVGLLLLVGAAVFLAALWPARLAQRRVSGLAWLGYGLLVAGSMGELVLQAPYAAGVSLTAITSRMFDAVIDTRYGTAHLVRLGLLAVTAPVLVGLAERRRHLSSGNSARPPTRWPLLCAVPIGLGLLGTWAWSGHAGTTEPGLSVPSDVVHLAAMAVWLGGLVVLAAALLPIAGARELRATLPAWSRLAMICVAALVTTGLVQGLLEVEGWSGLVDTTYGRLLLAKIALLAVILAVANFSRLWVKRHYAGGGGLRTGGNTAVPDATSRAEISKLRRAVSAESAFGAAAVAVAAVLIQAAPPRAVLEPPAPPVPTARPLARSGAYVAAVHRGDVVIHLKVDPAVVGVQYIYLDATRPGGAPVRVRQWTLTVSEPQLGIRDVDVPVIVDTGVGHRYIYGSFTMPVSGPWTIRVVARTSDVDETVVTRKVTLRS